MDFKEKERYNIDDLREIVAILRSENGCPWDKVQTHKSIRRDFLEETYEVLEAIDNDDRVLLREELGDVLLQVVFHSQIEQEQNNFNFDDVANDICHKLILRHPHVFADTKADTVDKVLENWESIKQTEKHRETLEQRLESVPKTFPALMRADKVQKRAEKEGYYKKEKDEALKEFKDKAQSFEKAVSEGENQKIESELGDLLFSLVSISRILEQDCEKVLTNSIEKFINILVGVEKSAGGIR